MGASTASMADGCDGVAVCVAGNGVGDENESDETGVKELKPDFDEFPLQEFKFVLLNDFLNESGLSFMFSEMLMVSGSTRRREGLPENVVFLKLLSKC